MGPSESVTRPRKKQTVARPKRRRRRLRPRHCLLKGCKQKFAPRQARQRYCSEHCRKEARKWSRWKAQQRYRESPTGKEKRNRQSRRYRERVKSRKPTEPKAVSEPARVIPQEHFFRPFLRPAGVLRALRAPAAKSVTALLLRILPARVGASHRAGAPLETGAPLSRTY